MPAALAAMAAHEQGKFWEYNKKLFANQQKLQRESLLEYARELGMDGSRFQQALDSARYKQAIEADVTEGKSVGVTGTPAFFVNGRFLSGARPFEDFAKLINEELVKQKLPIPAGAQQPAG